MEYGSCDWLGKAVVRYTCFRQMDNGGNIMDADLRAATVCFQSANVMVRKLGLLGPSGTGLFEAAWTGSESVCTV